VPRWHSLAFSFYYLIIQFSELQALFHLHVSCDDGNFFSKSIGNIYNTVPLLEHELACNWVGALDLFLFDLETWISFDIGNIDSNTSLQDVDL
jgi:hypothetical protein